LLRSKDARVLESDAWNFANNDEDEEDDIRRDESSGEVLPTKLVMEARQEELEFFKEKKVWKFVLITEAIRVTGKQPISVRWIDINKGDGDTMQIRSRLVAREMANRKSDEFFSAAPPLEAKRMLFSGMAFGPKKGSQEKKLFFVDVRRAYFNADATRDTYDQLPTELHMEGACAKLRSACMALATQPTGGQAPTFKHWRSTTSSRGKRLRVASSTEVAISKSSSTEMTSPWWAPTKTSTTSKNSFKPSSK
jgi:hypothetical protein